MLRAELRDSAETLSVKLEGRFTGPDAEHIRDLITRSTIVAKLVVDLAEIVFIDTVGEQVLSLLGRLGAEFVAPTSYALDVCERLHLPLAQTNGLRANKTHASLQITVGPRMIPRSPKKANEAVSERTMPEATHWCPARVLDVEHQAHCSVAARSTAAASPDLFPSGRKR